MLDGTENATDSQSVAPSDKKQSEVDAAQTGPFSIGSEAVGSFPGDWAPLKDKRVKIISVQQMPGTGRITSHRTNCASPRHCSVEKANLRLRPQVWY
jgi:hypothetical protein